MGDDRVLIRTMIKRWAEAVHEGDLDGVLADRAADIVMFDVPPPHQGVRGIDEYTRTWPGFLDWQASGAVFEIESLEVSAGDAVAFAFALLRCGTPDGLARNPESRLRLTLGLRKEDGRWVVAHEHHSFADTSGDQDAGAEERAVRAVHTHWSDRTLAGDLDGLMEAVSPDVVSYEHHGPLQYVGRDAVREVCRRGLAASSGPVTMDTPDLTVRVGDDLAVSWGLDRVRAEDPDGGAADSWSRATRVFAKSDGAWTLIHQHLSLPVANGRRQL